jgi:hypothetical protein
MTFTSFLTLVYSNVLALVSRCIIFILASFLIFTAFWDSTSNQPFLILGCAEPSSSEVEIAIEKLKRYKSPGIDQIPAELLQAGGNTIRSEIHKLFNCIWNKEELPEQWKESIIVPIYKKSNKTDCSNYRGISLLSTPYKILSNILLCRLTPYVDEIIGDHQCGFRRNR